jgi:predicted amidophosphoribosyltransferase
LAGAFRVRRNRQAALEGRNVLLVDDVITTGATVEACARALKRAGAARVDVLALALVTNEALVAA